MLLTCYENIYQMYERINFHLIFLYTCMYGYITLLILPILLEPIISAVLYWERYMFKTNWRHENFDICKFDKMYITFWRFNEIEVLYLIVTCPPHHHRIRLFWNRRTLMWNTAELLKSLKKVKVSYLYAFPQIFHCIKGALQ